MEIRKLLSTIVGAAQGIIGAVFAVLAVMLALNIIEVQTVFNVPPELLPLYLLILGLFSAFSIISGLFLVCEWRRST
jgi:membrane associated rhomboid family serine protease